LLFKPPEFSSSFSRKISIHNPKKKHLSKYPVGFSSSQAKIRLYETAIPLNPQFKRNNPRLAAAKCRKESIVQTRRILTLSFVIALSLAFNATAHATAYSALFVYGDSLSDNGNLYAATGYPPYPYYMGRFSNGPVAVEQLATRLGIPLYDFAYGGATTGIGNIVDGGTQTSFGYAGLPGMLTELAGAPPPAALAPTSLFVVWGGADDFESGGSLITAVDDIDEIVATLQAEGATHILVPGLPNLGLTPEFYGNPLATLYSEYFNELLQASLPAGATYDNTFNLLNEIDADPSAYGFTNVTTPCFNGISVCADPSQYLFWDDIHPTTTADAILAGQFYNNVTPEPSSLLLVGTCVASLAGLIRRHRN
jgi:cholinesterase